MIADVLNIYARERAEGLSAPETLGYCIKALAPFWGRMTVDKVKGEVCRRYVREREGVGVKAPTARRELGVLQAALRHCEVEGYLLSAPSVWLPPASKPRERWASRSEMARFLWHARRVEHLKRFTLIGLYSGSRSAVIRGLQWMPNTEGGHVNLDQGLLYREPAMKAQTKKRAPPARLQRRLLIFMRRWAGSGQWVVEWRGGPVASVKRSWRDAREAAGLGADFTPHILRHTAITWAMQRGARLSDIAGLFGITIAELERTYGHHSPDHMKSALDALERK